MKLRGHDLGHIGLYLNFVLFVVERKVKLDRLLDEVQELLGE